MLLAGDIGGTKTNLAVYLPEAGPRSPLAQATFPSTSYPSLAAIVREFLSHGDSTLRAPGALRAASFGVAGPVVAGRAEITNLPWTIDAHDLSESLGIPTVRLMNDLVATANAVPSLGADDIHTLSKGRHVPHGAIGVIAPGTGLGEAFLVWNGSSYQAFASEGGHCDFAPVDCLQQGLQSYLWEQNSPADVEAQPHVSIERVCSGRGVPSLYAYLRDTNFAEEPAWLAEELASAHDPTPVIVRAALGSAGHAPNATGIPPGADAPLVPVQLCAGAMDLFLAILGSEAGNLALKVLATGGVYLGGGIPPRILPSLESGSFLDAFRWKGRMSDVLADIPIHVITNPQVALIGAACYGLAHCDL